VPLRRSAARRASRKDEVSLLLGWNGEAEDAASGDDWPVRYVTCIVQRPPSVPSRKFVLIFAEVSASLARTQDEGIVDLCRGRGRSQGR